MPDIGITVKIIDKSQFIEQMFKRSKDAARLLLMAGSLLVKASRNAFDQQSFAGRAWKARKVPSILGVVKDLESGATVKESRFSDRPALVDTGALRASIGWSLLSSTSVRVSSQLPYARLHHEGGTSSRSVTPTVRSNLSIYLKSRPDRRASLGFILGKKLTSVTSRIPARPFLGVSPLMAAQLRSMTRDFVLQRGEFRRST